MFMDVYVARYAYVSKYVLCIYVCVCMYTHTHSQHSPSSVSNATPAAKTHLVTRWHF